MYNNFRDLDVFSVSSIVPYTVISSSRGRNIVRETLKVLVAQYGLSGNSTVIFSGCSAGGQGVINVVDYVSEYLSSIAPGAEVLGLADAGTPQHHFGDMPGAKFQLLHHFRLDDASK
jgi:hypothetical protein